MFWIIIAISIRTSKIFYFIAFQLLAVRWVDIYTNLYALIYFIKRVFCLVSPLFPKYSAQPQEMISLFFV